MKLNEKALEKAWHSHASGASGWSGAIPSWFRAAIEEYVKYVAAEKKARLKAAQYIKNYEL